MYILYAVYLTKSQLSILCYAYNRDLSLPCFKTCGDSGKYLMQENAEDLVYSL